MSESRTLNVVNMSFNAIRENKIIAKISEFTVIAVLSSWCIKLLFHLIKLYFTTLNHNCILKAAINLRDFWVSSYHRSYADIFKICLLKLNICDNPTVARVLSKYVIIKSLFEPWLKSGNIYR